MQSNHVIWGFSLQEWAAAIATVVSAVTVVVLAISNFWILKLTKKQAASATGSLNLLREEWAARSEQELINAITILRGAQDEVLSCQQKKDSWGLHQSMVQVHLLPEDWSVVVYQAGKISPDVRREVLNIRNLLASANNLINQWLSLRAGYRDEKLMAGGYAKLEEVTPRFEKVIKAFEQSSIAKTVE